MSVEDPGGTDDDVKPQKALQLLEISSAGLGVPLQPPVSHPTGTLLRFLCGLMADSTMSFWLFWESSQSRGCMEEQLSQRWAGRGPRAPASCKFSEVGLLVPDTWPQAWDPGGDPAPACLGLASPSLSLTWTSEFNLPPAEAGRGLSPSHQMSLVSHLTPAHSGPQTQAATSQSCSCMLQQRLFPKVLGSGLCDLIELLF